MTKEREKTEGFSFWPGGPLFITIFAGRKIWLLPKKASFCLASTINSGDVQFFSDHLPLYNTTFGKLDELGKTVSQECKSEEVPKQTMIIRPSLVIVALLASSGIHAVEERLLGNHFIKKPCKKVKGALDLTGSAKCDCKSESGNIAEIDCTAKSCLFPPVGPIPGAICGKFCA